MVEQEIILIKKMIKGFILYNNILKRISYEWYSMSADKKKKSSHCRRKKKNESNSCISNRAQITEIETTQQPSYLLKMTYNSIIYFCNITVKVIRVIVNIAGIYLLWILLHYTASHLYVKLCVPYDLTGFLISPFLTSTPHCQGLRWLIYNGATMINNMWVVLGTWFCANLLLFNNASATPTSAS